MTMYSASAAELTAWVGREIETTVSVPVIRDRVEVRRTITRRYRVVDAGRFSPDGELKLQIGSIKGMGISIWISAADAAVVAS